MANYNTPWNKGTGMSKAERQSRRKEYYAVNRGAILAKVKERAERKKPQILEYMRWYQIKKKYGLTQDAWIAMFSGQGGLCGLCQRDYSEKPNKLVVDHCHSTGRVRKLLCNRCNLIVGVFERGAELFAKAGEYVRGFK